MRRAFKIGLIGALAFSSQISYAQSLERVRGLSLVVEKADLSKVAVLFQCTSENCNAPDNFLSCKAVRPLLCFTDIDAPAPSYLKSSEYWSGGVIALTDPVEAAQFKTIDDANEFCAANFGEAWRLTDVNDGGGKAVRAYGHPGHSETRVWVDSKASPNMTCWKR